LDRCRIPLCGVPWHATRPPVDLDLWPRAEGEPSCFTTIATWENKGKNIEFEGTDYLWSKHVNFLKFLDLPRRRPQTCFEMAMLPPDDRVRREVEGARKNKLEARLLVPLTRGREANTAWVVTTSLPADAETGRGLMLVTSLSTEWGFYRTPAGKAVYFTLAFQADLDEETQAARRAFSAGSGKS